MPDAQAVGLGAQTTLRAAEQDRADLVAARAVGRTDLAKVDPRRLVFLDESGIDTRLTRAHARSAKGERALGQVPWGRWKRLTVVGALAREGVVACMSIAAATSTAVFQALDTLGLILLAYVHAADLPDRAGANGNIHRPCTSTEYAWPIAT